MSLSFPFSTLSFPHTAESHLRLLLALSSIMFLACFISHHLARYKNFRSLQEKRKRRKWERRGVRIMQTIPE
jgi:hypothetical protein